MWCLGRVYEIRCGDGDGDGDGDDDGDGDGDIVNCLFLQTQTPIKITHLCLQIHICISKHTFTFHHITPIQIHMCILLQTQM